MSDMNAVPSAAGKLPPETPIAMPAGLIFGTWAGTSALCAGAAFAMSPLGLLKPEVSVSATLGSILVSCIMLLGLLAMAPWAARTPSSWSSRWLAATVIRFVTTPFLALLLYSFPPSAEGFLLSVAGTYLVSLAVEAAVVAKSVLAAAAAFERR
ncbi:MAG: hypothetical protein FJ292_08620 [Planctomycetes bacterium]|nr:hypothetical protein [Planctomycetota bacterium]